MLTILVAAADSAGKYYAKVPLRLPTNFPPAFGGERAAFGIALFSQILIAMTSLAALIELRRLYRLYDGPRRAPAQMHRLALSGILIGIVMLALPNAIFNLLWAEVPTTPLYVAQQARVACQAFAFVPFLIGMTCLTLSRTAITWQLERKPLPVDLWANRQQMLQSAALGLCCFVIAILVALFK